MDSVLATLKAVNHALIERGLVGSIAYRAETSHMVRAGRNQISLNVSKKAQQYTLVLQKGKRQITAQLTPSQHIGNDLIQLAEALNQQIEAMPEVDYLTDMQPIAKCAHCFDKVDPRLDEAFDASVLVDLYQQAHWRFQQYNVEISGAFSAGHYSYALINTLSKEPVCYRGGDYNLEIVLQLLDHDKKELRAASVGEKLSHYNRDQLLSCLEKDYSLKISTPRVDIAAGRYDVIFSADAFAEMTAYMAWLTLSGESYEYQSGMLQKHKHQIGSKIFGDNITIVDNPEDHDTLFARRVGQNGQQRNNWTLIDKGVLKNQFYSDKNTCDRFKRQVNNDFGCASLKVQAGDGPGSFENMVASCIQPTIYIGFIHYMNFTNSSKGEFTGTSRFGTWLIENGEIKAHLFNLRINDSYHRIFSQVEWLSTHYCHVNTSNTYGMRNASAITVPSFVKVNGVGIAGSNANA
ncbi:MAG: metallopeptidase TldD-related protein [Pseudomonadota bacterium]